MIKRNGDLSQTICEIEAAHATRRQKGKAITAGALARLARLKDELANPPPPPTPEEIAKLRAAQRRVAAIQGIVSAVGMPIRAR